MKIEYNPAEGFFGQKPRLSYDQARRNSKVTSWSEVKGLLKGQLSPDTMASLEEYLLAQGLLREPKEPAPKAAVEKSPTLSAAMLEAIDLLPEKYRARYLSGIGQCGRCQSKDVLRDTSLGRLCPICIAELKKRSYTAGA